MIPKDRCSPSRFRDPRSTTLWNTWGRHRASESDDLTRSLGREMNEKMPRGAIPTPRSVLAASEPYRMGSGKEEFVPSGHFPSPNHELASARPFRASGPTPESWVAWPIRIATWKSKTLATSNWAEEAFAKACAEPGIFIPPEVLDHASRECGSSNFSAFMQ